MNEEDDKDYNTEWLPSAERFIEYQKEDTKMCSNNLEVILREANRPLTLRELKDSTLHNVLTVEAALKACLSSKRVREVPGKLTTYTLVVK